MTRFSLPLVHIHPSHTTVRGKVHQSKLPTDEEVLQLAAAVQASGDVDQAAEQGAEVLRQVPRSIRAQPTALQLPQDHTVRHTERRD